MDRPAKRLGSPLAHDRSESRGIRESRTRTRKSAPEPLPDSERSETDPRWSSRDISKPRAMCACPPTRPALDRHPSPRASPHRTPAPAKPVPAKAGGGGPPADPDTTRAAADPDAPAHDAHTPSRIPSRSFAGQGRNFRAGGPAPGVPRVGESWRQGAARPFAGNRLARARYLTPTGTNLSRDTSKAIARRGSGRRRARNPPA